MNIIEQIKAEIKRLNNKMDDGDLLAPNQKAGYLLALADILSFLDTLESEKPINLNDDLNFALDKYVGDLDEELQKKGCTYEFNWDDITETIREVGTHFAKWGAEHTKIDVTDFCKPIDPGIAQCIADYSWEMLGEDENPVPNDFEEAADEYSNKAFPNEPAIGQWGTGDYEPPVDMEYPREIAKDAFKVGAKWQKEQIMSMAVEGEVKDFRFIREINYASAKIEFNSIPKLKEDNKVCIIVKEDSHE